MPNGTQTDNPLARLLVEAIDTREELAAILDGFVTIDESGSIAFSAGFDSQPARRRVLVAVLAARAAFELDLRDEGSATPADIEQLTGMPGGTVRPKLRELAGSRVLHCSDGRYVVPDSQIRRAAELVGNGAEEVAA